MTVTILPESGMAELPFLDNIVEGTTILCHERDEEDAKTRFPGCVITTYDSHNLTPCRSDLFALAERLDLSNALLVRDEERPWGWDAYVTTLGLMGVESAGRAGQSGMTEIAPPKKPDMAQAQSLLLVACGGIGNVIQATPLLSAALNAGLTTYFCPVSDATGGSLGELFHGALEGLHVVEPEQLAELDADIRINVECRAHMQPGEFFHSPYRESMRRHEAEAYAQLFTNITGLHADPAATCLGGKDVDIADDLKGRTVLCPGSKPGWDSKRWPHFGELAQRLDNPVVLCREADLDAYENIEFLKPMTAPNATLVTDGSLPEAAAILRHARGVIANDCGLAHMAAATGTTTLALFGPSSMEKNRPLPDNALSLSLCMDCQPCQGSTDGPGRLGPGDYHCELGYCCLQELDVDRVLDEASRHFNQEERA